MKAPKAPPATAQELAGVARQSRMIDEQTEELEKRLKARGKLGSKSLLAKAGKKASGGSGKGSIMGGGGYTGTPYSGGGSGGSSASRQR